MPTHCNNIFTKGWMTTPFPVHVQHCTAEVGPTGSTFKMFSHLFDEDLLSHIVTLYIFYTKFQRK